jgi:hypothetical protein
VGGAALVSVDSALADLDALPEQFRQIVEALTAAQRSAAWSAFASGADTLFVFRETRLKNRIFLTSSQRGLGFSFRRPAEAEVVLDADVSMTLRPRVGSGPRVEPVTRLEASMPRFFGSGVGDGTRRALSAVVGGDPARLVFVDLGPFALAARNAGDIDAARAAFMLKSAASGDLVLPRPGANFSFAPLPMLLVLNAIAEWHAGSSRIQTLSADRDAAEAAPRVLAALVEAWNQSRIAGQGQEASPEIAALLPGIAATDFEASVVLRLKDDGRLAARRAEDNFQLRLSLRSEGSRLMMRVAPPDFLVSGSLHAQMLQELKTQEAMKQLVEQSAGNGRLVNAFLEGPAPIVFRAQKNGADDIEMFVFKRDWSDISGMAATLPLRVEREEGSPDGALKVVARGRETKLVYLCAEGEGVQPVTATKDFPRHLLKLVDRLHNWEEAFR